MTKMITNIYTSYIYIYSIYIYKYNPVKNIHKLFQFVSTMINISPVYHPPSSDEQRTTQVNTAILELGQTCHLRPTGSDIIVLRVPWQRGGLKIHGLNQWEFQDPKWRYCTI